MPRNEGYSDIDTSPKRKTAKQRGNITGGSARRISDIAAQAQRSPHERVRKIPVAKRGQNHSFWIATRNAVEALAFRAIFAPLRRGHLILQARPFMPELRKINSIFDAIEAIAAQQGPSALW